MTMDQFRRKAYRVRRHCGQSALVDLPCAGIGKRHMESKRTQECPPERHCLPECEHSRDTDRNVTLLQRLRMGIFPQEQFLSCTEKVRHGICLLHCVLQFLFHFRISRISQNFSPLTAVVGNPGIPVGESKDGTLTVVGAERAWRVCFLSVGKSVQIIQADECPVFRILFEPFPGDQRDTDRSHQSRIRSPDHFFSNILFHRAEHSVIGKCSSLNNDPIPQGIHI